MTGIESWLFEYGSAALFFLLALGIVGLPIPDETLIVLAGVLVAKGKLALIPTLIAIYSGGMCGITISYLLGYTCGNFLIERYGYLVRITPQRISRTKQWFKQIGKWLLFFGYFILGLRHLTGLVAGMVKLNYRQFALFAYAGQFVWASTMFTIGYSFTRTWRRELNTVTYIGIVIAVTAFLCIYAYFFYHQRKINKIK